jgi:RNA polymerase sigma-70 factor (ECF subfamily)
MAEDLVQATALRALERAGQFTPGTRLDRWLFVILRSVWINEVRSRRVREGGGTVPAGELAYQGDVAIETNILAQQVLTQVMGLSEAQREAVFLVYAEGHTYSEAATIMAVPVGTVMSRLAAARLSLASLKSDN